MAGTVNLDPAAIAMLARSREVRDACLHVAEEIAQVAQSIAPVGRTGDYQRSIVGRLTEKGAEVVATDYKAHWIEFGVHPGGGATFVPGRHVLTNAADQAGYPVSSH